MAKNKPQTRDPFWRILGAKILRWFLDIVAPFFIVFFPPSLGLYLRTSDFSLFSFWNVSGIVAIAGIITLLQYLVRSAEKRKVKMELDQQYKTAFSLSSQSIYDLHAHIKKATNNGAIPQYISELRLNLSETVKAILEANLIQNNTITANLMIEHPSVAGSQRYLEIVAFGPKRPHREKKNIPLTDKLETTTKPGAPVSFLSGKTIYTDDTTKPEYVGLFNTDEYKSFFSIAIRDSDTNTGKVFAVLNVDSDRVGHFTDIDFINSKIYPALTPGIALIKLLRKTGQI